MLMALQTKGDSLAIMSLVCEGEMLSGCNTTQKWI